MKQDTNKEARQPIRSRVKEGEIQIRRRRGREKQDITKGGSRFRELGGLPKTDMDCRLFWTSGCGLAKGQYLRTLAVHLPPSTFVFALHRLWPRVPVPHTLYIHTHTHTQVPTIFSWTNHHPLFPALSLQSKRAELRSVLLPRLGLWSATCLLIIQACMRISAISIQSPTKMGSRISTPLYNISQSLFVRQLPPIAQEQNYIIPGGWVRDREYIYIYMCREISLI